MGDEIDIPTLTGKAKLKIPPGTQPGTAFRLRGKGLPSVRGEGTGDELVSVAIQVPTHLSGKQRSALEEFAKASGESVHPQKGLFKKLFKG
jgi:molecular chaperone DnaJ